MVWAVRALLLRDRGGGERLVAVALISLLQLLTEGPLCTWHGSDIDSIPTTVVCVENMLKIVWKFAVQQVLQRTAIIPFGARVLQLDTRATC